MAYSTPPTWAYLEYPTAAKFNQYQAGLDAIHAQVGDAITNPAISRRLDTVQGYYIVHEQRWLLHLNGGRIEDPAGVGDTVTLDDNGGWNAHDLATVDWIYPGKLYQVQAANCCFEDVTGL